MSCCFFRTLWVLSVKASVEALNAWLQSEPWVKHFGFLRNRNMRTTRQSETQNPSSQESCIQLWPVVETHNKHLWGTEWRFPHVVSQLWAGCTTWISSSFSHWEDSGMPWYRDYRDSTLTWWNRAGWCWWQVAMTFPVVTGRSEVGQQAQ